MQEKSLAFSDIKSLVEGQFTLTIIHASKPLRRQSMFNAVLYNTVSLRHWQILVTNIRWTSPNSDYHFYSLAVGRAFKSSNVLPCCMQCITLPQYSILHLLYPCIMAYNHTSSSSVMLQRDVWTAPGVNFGLRDMLGLINWSPIVDTFIHNMYIIFIMLQVYKCE